jgi:mevalonate kinase
MAAMESTTGRGHYKVILLGEHAVVHGCPALGAALDVTVDVRVGSGPELAVEGTGDPETVRPALAAMLAAASMQEHLAVTVHSPLPSGAGLGGSAALCVGFARALLSLRDLPQETRAVVDLADAGERVFHGEPSGIDAHLAATGSPAIFRKGAPPRPLELGAPLRLCVLVDPGRRPTAAMVARVARLLAHEPQATRSLFAEVGELVERGVGALAEGDTAALGRALVANHEILGRLRVSTPALDGLCEAARRAGALGAKMTGGGGGGAVIALVEDEAAAARVIESAAGRVEAAFTATVPASR